MDPLNQELNHDWLGDGDGNTGDLMYEWNVFNKIKENGGVPLRDGKKSFDQRQATQPTLSSQLGLVVTTTTGADYD